MLQIPTAAGAALLVSTIALVAYGVLLLTRWAARTAAARRATVAHLLSNPELLQRVWFVQRAYNTHHEVLLRGRNQAGTVITLATPGETPQVWHRLQLAGVLVHPGP